MRSRAPPQNNTLLILAQFWKQFFESSANVSLSGYEEQPSQYENADTAVIEDTNTTTHTTLETSESYETPSAQHISTDSIQDLDLSNLTISPSQSTPRPNARQKTPQANFADYPSPYETLRQEVNNTTVDANSLTQVTMPETPGRPVFPIDDIAATPQSSPFLPPQPTSIPRPSTIRKKTDPLLHRVLDRNYRVQATPLTTSRFANIQPKTAHTPSTSMRTRTLEPDLSSSPEAAPPELHPEIFSSPERRKATTRIGVLTPARSKGQTSKPPTRTPGIWDSDDDDLDEDLAFGQSPPKTMQFHIPQNRLLRTPGTLLGSVTLISMIADGHFINSKRGLETNCRGHPNHCRDRLRPRRNRF